MIPSNLLTVRFNSNHITSSWSLGCVMLCHHISSSWLPDSRSFFAHVAARKTLHDPPECQTFWNRFVSRCHLTSPNDTCETIDDETSRSAFRIFSGSFSRIGPIWTGLWFESTSQHLHLGSPPRRFFDDCRPVLPCISNLSTEYVRWNCLGSLEHHKRLISRLSSEKSWKNATAPHNVKSTVVQYACCMPFDILLHAKGQGPERSSWILRRPFLGIQKTRSAYEYHHSTSRGVDMVWKLVEPPCWCSGLIRSLYCVETNRLRSSKNCRYTKAFRPWNHKMHQDASKSSRC